ncbi:MAG: hypothetical protein V4690_01140 [Patescibacteria group bacterium]
MTTVSIVILEEGKTPVLARATAFPGARTGPPSELVAELAEVLKARENGEGEVLYSEKDGINLLDRK